MVSLFLNAASYSLFSVSSYFSIFSIFNILCAVCLFTVVSYCARRSSYFSRQQCYEGSCMACSSTPQNAAHTDNVDKDTDNKTNTSDTSTGQQGSTHKHKRTNK